MSTQTTYTVHDNRGSRLLPPAWNVFDGAGHLISTHDTRAQARRAAADYRARAARRTAK